MPSPALIRTSTSRARQPRQPAAPQHLLPSHMPLDVPSVITAGDDVCNFVPLSPFLRITCLSSASLTHTIPCTLLLTALVSVLLNTITTYNLT